MANKPLQSIKFPGLSDTYTVPQIDSTLAVQGKAADAKAAGDKIAAVSAMTAEAFSTSTAYAVGDHVTYNGALYVFTTAHSAGAWNSSHVSAVTVEGELTNLKDDLSETVTTNFAYDLYPGYHNADGTGTGFQIQDRLEVMTNKIFVGGVTSLHVVFDNKESVAMWGVYVLYDENGSILGTRNSLVSETNSHVEKDIEINSEAYYIAFSYRSYGTVNLTVSAKSNVNNTYNNYNVDKPKIDSMESKTDINTDITLSGYNEIEYTKNPGYYTVSNGTVNFKEKQFFYEEINTGYIETKPKNSYLFTINYHVERAMWANVIFFDNDKNLVDYKTLISIFNAEHDKILKNKVFIFETPNKETVKYFIVSYRSFDYCEANLYKKNLLTEDDLTVAFSYDLFTGYHNTDGKSIGIQTQDQLEVMTSKIFVGGIHTLHVVFDNKESVAMWGVYVLYDENGSILGTRNSLVSETNSHVEKDIEINSGVYYIAFSYRSYGTVDFTITAKGNIDSSYYNYNIDKHHITSIESKTDINLDISLADYDKIDYIPSQGYYTKLNNTIKFKEQAHYYKECNTGFISVEPGDIYLFTMEHQIKRPMWCSTILVDADNNVIKRDTIVNIGNLNADKYIKSFVFSITIPNNDIIKYLIINYNTFDYCEANLYKKKVLDGIVNLPIVLSPGYLNPNGEIAPQSIDKKECLTNHLYVRGMRKIHVTINYDEEVSSWASYMFYTKDKKALGNRIVFISNLTLSNWEDDIEIPSDAYYIILSFRTFGTGSMSITGKYITGITNNLYEYITTAMTSGNEVMSPIYSKIMDKPCYDHLFVIAGASPFIPHESLYHFNLSKRLGFNIVEINTSDPTTDGIRIANHLSHQKFGEYFHHIDGITDISDVDIKSVSWEWIKENVRYNSTIEKYRTAPETVEEALYACKANDLIPFINARASDIVELADNIIGSNNYIAYGASRANCPTQLIYHWVAGESKEDILNYCKGMGKPFCYGLSTPTRFSLSELKEIVDLVHSNGYLIGTSYVDQNWCEYRKIGFDLNGAQRLVNRINNGNLCNYNSVMGFSNYIVTNGVETNGVLSFEEDGTITPNINNTVYSVSAFDLSIRFKGNISIDAIGESRLLTVSYTESDTYFVCVPVFNGTPKPIIRPSAGTVIYDIDFRASTF